MKETHCHAEYGMWSRLIPKEPVRRTFVAYTRSLSRVRCVDVW